MENIKKLNDRVRNLTLAQLDTLQSLISNERPIVTSREVLAGCKQKDVSGQSLASLASLAKGDKPLVKKVGRASTREGLLWKFNSGDWDMEGVRTVVADMMGDLKEGGFFTE